MILTLPPPAINVQSVLPEKKWIGEATMELDGTIRMRVRMEYHGTVGDSLKVYKPDNPEYFKICAHFQNLKPGTSVSIYNDWNSQDTSGR